MKEPKNLIELRDNLQSSFDKAIAKDDNNSQIRARIYEMILNSVNNILKVETVKLREDCYHNIECFHRHQHKTCLKYCPNYLRKTI